MSRPRPSPGKAGSDGLDRERRLLRPVTYPSVIGPSRFMIRQSLDSFLLFSLSGPCTRLLCKRPTTVATRLLMQRHDDMRVIEAVKRFRCGRYKVVPAAPVYLCASYHPATRPLRER